MNLQTYEWNFKKFTSQDRLQTLFMSGLINREITMRNSYGAWYKFSTKDGQEIATFYKDDTFGFSSQATGIELKTVLSL